MRLSLEWLVRVGLTDVLKAKVCLIGEAAVGKTSLVRRYVESAFTDRYISTLGSRVSVKRITLEPTGDAARVQVDMSIWDLIGEQSYLETLHKEYLRGAQGLIAVCDLSRYSTFEALDPWISGAFRITGPIPLALVVNKVDLRSQVICLYEDDEPAKKAERYGGFAARVSARSGENVPSIFTKLAQEILRRIATTTVAR